jgi:hypothetical protein
MSKCFRSFQAAKCKKLQYLSIHFMQLYGTDIKDLIPIISKYIVFTFHDHIGGFVPLYYQSGLPCRTWTCVNCKEQFSEYDNCEI